MQVGSITVRHDINSLEGVPLAKKGDKLTPEFIQDLSLKRNAKPTRVPFFSTASFQEDVETFLSEHQYERVFPTSDTKARTLQAVRQHSIYSVVADVLSYVKTIDYDGYRHLLVASALATRLAIDLQVRLNKKFAIHALAPGHDIGKFALPVEVLTKIDPLNEEDRDWIQHHTIAGYVLLTYYVGNDDPYFCKVAFDHHEKMGGSGYSRKINQTDETIQVMTVCDMFNALISPRPFRKEPFSVSKAVQILEEEAEQGKLSKPAVALLKSQCQTG